MVYEDKDLESVAKLRRESEEFVRLESEHAILKKRVDEVEKSKYLSPDEEIQKKELQKKKLRLKDQIMRMVAIIQV